MVINHLLSGMILQVNHHTSWAPKKIVYKWRYDIPTKMAEIYEWVTAGVKIHPILIGAPCHSIYNDRFWAHFMGI